MKCVAKKDGHYSTKSGVKQAMDHLEPGMSVDCYEDDGSSYGSFGLVDGCTPIESEPVPSKAATPIYDVVATTRGPIGMFGDIEAIAYRMSDEITLRVDKREYEEYTALLFFKVVKERVMFTASGTEEATDKFIKKVKKISDEYTRIPEDK